METAGKTLEEKELSDALRDLGLGTPATRAQIIETLLRREYAVRDGKTISATDKGIHLISVVHPDVKSPAMTGEWEAKLKRMSRGDGDLPTFMAGIAAFVTDVVGRVTTGTLPAHTPPRRPATPTSDPDTTPPAPKPTRKRTAETIDAPPASDLPSPSKPTRKRTAETIDAPPASDLPSPSKPTRKRATDNAPPASDLPPPSKPTRKRTAATIDAPPASDPPPSPAPRTPTAPDDLRQLLKSRFNFSSFRPHQEAVCRAATQGRDLLLVMPTGAGKSCVISSPASPAAAPRWSSARSSR
jgi:DNA topoisomerase-3